VVKGYNILSRDSSASDVKKTFTPSQPSRGFSAMKKQTQLMLGKMVGMLGSEQDGEVLAAARAIRRLLQSEGLTFGDLVSLVSGGQKAELAQYDGLAGMAAALLNQAGRMKAHELRFVQSIMTRATLTPYFRMTEKQANWFAMLWDKYGG
jgi:hypothetical protein